MASSPTQQHPFPLLTNSNTGEPYLAPPPPLADIVITPPRASDAPALVPILNDPRVHTQLSLRALPFTLVDAHAFVKRAVEEYAKVREELESERLESGLELKSGLESESGADSDSGHSEVKAPRGPTGLRLVHGCPLRCIRQVQADGSDVYIGDIMAKRYKFFDVADPEEAQRLIAENNAKPLGDPSIIWSLSNFLSPAYHSQGIMSAVMQSIITQWMVPRMGVRYMRVCVRTGNVGSARVFAKNGFALVRTVADPQYIRTPLAVAGGVLRDDGRLHVLEWGFEGQKDSVTVYMQKVVRLI